MATHTLTAQPTHSVWSHDLAPRITVESGDTLQLETQDATGGQLNPTSTLADYLAIDRDRIHALTGPIAIAEAMPGDVLEVEILEVAHTGWGWTSLVPGLGFLDERFRTSALFHWELIGEVSRSLAPATVPLRPFCGVMGVAQAAPGSFRTRPPGTFGGNMDVRDLHTGSTLYLPVQVPGALFSAGDAHAAQGDGEVCINGIECPAHVTLRLTLHKDEPLAGPLVESSPRALCPGGEFLVVESASPGPEAPDAALTAARAATSRMVDLLTGRWGFTPEHAYILCSVAMDLRLAQVVNTPMTTVTAAIPRHILPARRLFGMGTGSTQNRLLMGRSTR